jgi:hypothetical protein
VKRCYSLFVVRSSLFAFPPNVTNMPIRKRILDNANSPKPGAIGQSKTRKADSEKRLPNHQHFAYVVAPKKKLDRGIFTEEILDMPIVKDPLQFVGTRRLQF